MHKNFADWYESVDLHPNAQTLDLRWKAIEKFSQHLELGEVADLVRVFFSRNGDEAIREKLREFAKNEDATYLSTKDTNELSIIAGGVIAEAVKASSEISNAVAYAVLCADRQGITTQVRLQGVVDETSKYLVDEAFRRRQTDFSQIRDLKKEVLKKQLSTKAGVAVTDWETEWKAIEAVFTTLLTEHGLHTKSIGITISDIIGAQQEQTDILWWLFSEYTLDGAKPFSRLGIPNACFWGARDLARLTRYLPGPIAAAAFLQKMLKQTSRKVPEKITIAEAVNACDPDWKNVWGKDTSIQQMPDFCPMLFALCKAAEVGDGESWVAAFEYSTQLKVETQILPHRLALQIYNELLLLRALGKKS